MKNGEGSPPHGLRLRGVDPFAADPREAQQAQQVFLVVARALGGRLGLGDLAAFEQHEVGVRVGRAVLEVVEVEHRGALVDAARDRGNLGNDRILGDRAGLHQPVDRQPQRHPRAGNGRGARAAVGLEHVAVEDDLPLAELFHVGHRAQRAADQPLDLLRPPALLALGRLAAAAGVRRARKHRVLGGDPALALVAQERRDFLLDAGGDQHAGVAEADKDRALGVLGEARLDIDDAHFVGRAAGWTHGGTPFGDSFSAFALATR